MRDPLAEADHNVSLSPYNYVNNNPLSFVDPNGLDWYVNDSTGALHWYNGNYANEFLEAPEGYSYLGKDDYFGGAGIINIIGRIYSEKEEGKDPSNTYDFNPDEAVKWAEDMGFEKLPTSLLLYEYGLKYHSPSGPWQEGKIVGDEIWLTVTYKPLGTYAKPGNKEFYEGSYFDPKRVIYTSDIEYSKPVTWRLHKQDKIGKAIIKALSFDFSERKIDPYHDGWESYPNNGYLIKYK